MTVSSIVSRCATVIDTLTASSAPLSFTRIMTLTGLPRSSTHRILSILLEERLVALDRERQTYRAGPRLIGWAANAFRLNDLPELCAETMDRLNRQTGHHVALSVLEGASVLYLKTVDSTEPYRLAPRVGERSPLHACAAGKALLAYLRPQKRAALLAGATLERYTDHTILTAQAVEADLRQVRVRGFALCDREEFLQVVGIAAPLRDHHGDPVGALSLWDEVARQDIDGLVRHGRVLLDATQELSARLGFEARTAAG